MQPTHDLDLYYREVRQIPRLSEQEKADLNAAAPTNREARNRLIEGHLNLVKAILLKDCPPHLYHLLPEMIAEANLGLVVAAQRYETQPLTSCTRYFLACAKAYAMGARRTDFLIRVPYQARARAREAGTLHELYHLQPVSLDETMERFQRDTVEDLPMAAITSLAPAPEHNPALRAQVEEYLSYLSHREQTILRLHYGLSDEDECAYGEAEIARMLHIPRKTVDSIIHGAFLRLRALGEGTATIVEQAGRKRVVGVYQGVHRQATLSLEQEAQCQQACTRLQEQGKRVTVQTLTQESGLPRAAATAFLRSHPALRTARATQADPERRARLEAACTRLQAQGKAVTNHTLATEAHIGKVPAAAFLREKRGLASGNEQEGVEQHANPSLR